MILHAEIAGDGPPVVLLHGLFGQARNLAGVARGLARGRRVISLDLRNHGASPHAAGMSYREMASDVLETLAALDALPAAFLGHSMGGKAAMACALMAPESVQRLLVADIAPVAYAHHNAGVAAAMLGLELRPGLDRAGASRALEAGVPDAAVRGFLLQSFVPGAAPSWRIGLAEIAAGIGDIEGWPDFSGARFDGPVLFVGGERSDYMSQEGRDAARALFPAVRFLTLKNAGHWLHADQPAAFLQVAEAFFGAV